MQFWNGAAVISDQYQYTEPNSMGQAQIVIFLSWIVIRVCISYNRWDQMSKTQVQRSCIQVYVPVGGSRIQL